MFISDDQSVQGVLQNCTFSYNFARSFGGGSYVILFGRTTHHFIRIYDCMYLGNTAGIGGGGAIVGYLPVTEGLEAFNEVQFRRCHFSDNKGCNKNSECVF